MNTSEHPHMTRIALFFAFFVVTDPVDASDPPDLVTKLNKSVSMKGPIDSALDLALNELAEHHRLTGKILIDVPAFKAAGVEDVRAEMVKLDKLESVRLSTILEGLLNQVDGTFIIRDTHLLITT